MLILNIAVGLFTIRMLDQYTIIGALICIGLFIALIITKKRYEKLRLLLLIPIFEYFELIKDIPVSLPYLLIAGYIFITLKWNKILTILLTILIIVSYISVGKIDNHLTIKIAISYFVINISLYSLNWIDAIKNEEILNSLKKVFYIIIIFWVIELLAYLINPSFKDNVTVGFDYRPIGYFSEPTYYILMICMYSILISKIKNNTLLVGIIASIISQSRIFTPFLMGKIIYERPIKSLIIFVLIIPVLYNLNEEINVDNLNVIGRFFDPSDELRSQILNYALAGLNYESIIIPPMSEALNATGIYYLQIYNVFGAFFGTLLFIYLIINLVRKAGYIGLIFIIVSFFHPIQYSSISLVSLMLAGVLKRDLLK